MGFIQSSCRPAFGQVSHVIGSDGSRNDDPTLQEKFVRGTECNKRWECKNTAASQPREIPEFRPSEFYVVSCRGTVRWLAFPSSSDRATCVYVPKTLTCNLPLPFLFHSSSVQHSLDPTTLWRTRPTHVARKTFNRFVWDEDHVHVRVTRGVSRHGRTRCPRGPIRPL